MGDERAAAWLRLKQDASAKLDPLVQPIVANAARRSWGRGLFRPPWRIVLLTDEVAWRAYRYLGTVADEDHRYYELGVTAHLDQQGNLVGFGVDNGVDFIGLHDVSDYGLKRGLEYIRQQRPRVRSYTSPTYDHPLKPFSS
ncbi:MAG: hypothetical protein AB7P40_14835 [Chloroflexota bacterium]